MNRHDDNVYINHILESILKIEQFVKNYTYDSFINDIKTIDAVVRNFEIIGEASNNISNDFKESHPE